LQYELSTLESSVFEAINQVNADKEKIENVQKESKRVKDAFLREMLSYRPEEAFQKYTHLHQKGLVDLMNTVYASRPKEYESDKTIIKAVLTELENLLTFLVSHFQQNIALEIAVPNFIRERELIRLDQNLETVGQKLNEFQSHESLTQLIVDTIKAYTTTEGDIFYYQFFFFRELESLLDNLEGIKEYSIDPHKALVGALCRINFNSLSFFHYCKDCVFGLISMQKEIWDEIFNLKRCLSLSGEIQNKPRICYTPSKAHITVSLTNWINDTMYMKECYVKKKLEELEVLCQESAQKMTTTLTVGELAVITRLFIEGGVYVAKNKKVLSYFMTRNFVTIQKDIDEELSPDHFRNSLTAYNNATFETVEAILNRMKARLEKIKNEKKGNPKD
jgi:hypothetical protein